MKMNKQEFLEGLAVQRQLIEAECPAEVAGSYRNQDETITLGLASSDESRIRILGALAREERVDPNNELFIFDLAQHFDDPSMVFDARRVAQFEQIPKTPLGFVERSLRKALHPSIKPYL